MISFKGLKILDLTRLLPGGYATQFFAEYGAEIIKVEDTEKGDYLRDLGPSFASSPEFSCYFSATNYSKQSIALNLKTEEGRQIFYRLAETADVIVESFRPGTVERLKIDYSAVKAINPTIIYCSISAFGQTGNRAKMPGHDINFLSLSGFLDVNGSQPESKPAIPGTQIADIGSGVSATLGIVSALYQRQLTGEGQYIDISMFDVISTWMLNPYLDYLSTGRVSNRGRELLNGGVLCYHIYETVDHRYLAFGAVEDKFWQQICDILEMPELREEAFSVANTSNRNYVLLQNKIKAKTLAEWNAIFDTADCCVTPVLNTEEVMKENHFRDRNIVEYISLNNLSSHAVPKIRLPIKFGSAHESLNAVKGEFASPPKQGDHSVEILKKANYTEQEINHLLDKGIIKN